MGRETSDSSDLLAGVHVLVVEDSSDARELFKTILEYAGALVTVADSAEQALGFCEHIVPDVLVTDIAMPGHDGFWLLAELRARRAAGGRLVPAVAVTGQGHGAPRRFEGAGFAEVLQKPVDPWELCRVVEGLSRR